ncbi:MAG: glycosyltransferase family 39 protein [Anaerolineaceae bacterium]|nr:glycosyltransferase family 39 protein [Anaerolineaceae bacterium]
MPLTTMQWILYFIVPAIVLDILLMRWWRKNHASNQKLTEKSIAIPWLKNQIRRIKAFFTRPLLNTEHPETIPWSIYTLNAKMPTLSDEIPHRGLTQRSKSQCVWDGILLAAFLVSAVYGQYQFSIYSNSEKQGLLYYGIACLILILLIFRLQIQSPSVASHKIPLIKKRSTQFDLITLITQNPRRSILFGVAIILSIISLLLLINRPSDHTHWDIFIIWVLSIISYAGSLLSVHQINTRSWMQNNRYDIIAILLLTLFAAILRFSQLGSMPNVISGDEGRFGTIIMDIMDGQIRNMFITIFGNSTMYFFFLAGMMKIFGISFKILRIGSAIGGTLTIPFLYLFAKQLFNRRTAWISTLLLVVSNFHVHFSRIMSVTSIQDAFFATLSLYFFYTGLKKHSRNRMLLAGLSLGLALYVYMGARLIILLIPIFLLFLCLFKSQLVKSNFINLCIFIGALLISALPMIYWAISNPITFNARAYQMGVFQSGWLITESAKTGFSQLRLFLILFKQAFLTTIYYPSYGFHNSNLPMLDKFSSPFFIAGLIYSLLHTRDDRYLLLNGWFWSGILVGGALVILPSFNAYRILIIFPVICLFCGIGVDKLLEILSSMLKQKTPIPVMISTLIVIAFTFSNIHAYFITYGPTCQYGSINTRLASQVAAYVADLDPVYTPVLLTAPRLKAHTHLTMDFVTPGIEYLEFIDPIKTMPDELNARTAYVFFFIPSRSNELDILQKAFPNGEHDQITDCGKPVLSVYFWQPE